MSGSAHGSPPLRAGAPPGLEGRLDLVEERGLPARVVVVVGLPAVLLRETALHLLVAIALVGMGENTQILRLGLLKNFENLRRWTPTQRDEIDGLAGDIIARTEVRPQRTEGRPVGYLYE